jgi:hypothetical protein
MSRSIAGRWLAVTVPVLLLLGAISPPPAQAAEDTLRLAVAATYRVDPGAASVRVRLDIEATSLAADTPTQIFFFNTLRFAVQPEARHFAATSGDLDLPVSVEARNGFRAVSIAIPDLYYQQTRDVRLTFDLPSGEPRSSSPIRVGQAHADFVAWAWGDAGLGDVRIVVPGRFEAVVQTLPSGVSEPIDQPTTSGRLEYVADRIDSPAQWYASVEASDQSALTDVLLALPGKRIRIHAWPEDDEWLRRVSRVLGYGLPGLETAIGLPWPVTDDLGVTEVTSAEIQGYAGIYDSADDEIRISEELDPLVIVHEASHAWFDGDLFIERWINEGLADEYASRIISANTERPRPAPDPVERDDPAAFPLNVWPPPSRVDTSTQASETYGYDAAWTVVRSIVREVGVSRMRDVLRAAAMDTMPYLGADPDERTTGRSDWRRFLDLVEEIGGATSASDSIRDWVTTRDQREVLQVRAEVRDDYADLLEAGDAWLPGVVIRRAMTAWRFDEAEAAIDRAMQVLADRDRLERSTDALGLGLPPALETAYESATATDDLAALDDRIGDWQTAAGSLQAAHVALQGEREPLVQLGLFDVDPSAGYETAVDAFVAGDDTGAFLAATDTLRILDQAEGVGRGRATAVVVGGLAVLILGGTYVVVRRRRHRTAAASPLVGPDGTDPYATLAATADPLDRDEAGVSGVEGAEPD